MNSLRLIGLALATAAVLAFPAYAAVSAVSTEPFLSTPADQCISLVEGALVSKFMIAESACNTDLAELTGLCLVPIDGSAAQPEHVVLLIPATLDTACTATRPSPPG